MVSATSSGFFSSLGAARPSVSLRKQAITSTKAGIQNHGCANQGSRARCSGVWACRYFHTPTALTPSSGEIAAPVMTEIAFASSTPGVAGLADGAGFTVSPAQAEGGDQQPLARAIVTAKRTNSLMPQRLRLFGVSVKRGVVAAAKQSTPARFTIAASRGSSAIGPRMTRGRSGWNWSDATTK